MMTRRCGRRGAALALGVLLLAAGAAAAIAEQWPGDLQTPEAKLWRVLEKAGAESFGFSMGRACPACPRGVLAARDFKEGEDIMKVPFSAAYLLEMEDPEAPAMSATFARHMLTRMHTDPGWNQTWGLFWATQPGPDEVFTPEVWTDHHIEMLQAPTIERRARWHREVTEQVYNGTYEYAAGLPHLAQLAPGVAPATFMYVTAVIGTRYFSRRYHNTTELPHLVPMIEMVNHADHPNAERADDDDFVYLRATEAIKAGEEVTISYKPGSLHRPDMSLYSYGFVPPRERPLLASLDVLGFDPRDFFKHTPDDDSEYDEGGELACEEEYHRLSARVNSLPTSEEEDRQLLAEAKDWQEQAILRFRVQRKQALHIVLDALEATLGLHEEHGEDEGEHEAAEGEEGGEGEEHEEL